MFFSFAVSQANSFSLGRARFTEDQLGAEDVDDDEDSEVEVDRPALNSVRAERTKKGTKGVHGHGSDAQQQQP